MLGFKKALKYLFVLGPLAIVEAVPTDYWVTRALAKRQAAAAAGLSDVDILQFALTAEHLESAFYNKGFSQFSKSDFQALGLSSLEVDGLLQVGIDEQIHESTLLSALTAQGVQPVEPCQYNFEFSSADQMLSVARVLEAVGVSAYLGAAPLIKDPTVLTAAGEIVTTEGRHQTLIRAASKADPVPAAFDTPLGPRSVFTLLAQFVVSCPSGSELNIPPFNTIALNGAQDVAPGQNLVVAAGNSMASGAKFCTFLNQNNVQFAKVNADGSCEIPQNLAGETYMLLTTSESADDSAVVAGPSVLSIS